MSNAMKVVEGGGFRLLTADPIMISVVRRCAELEQLLRQAQHHEGRPLSNPAARHQTDQARGSQELIMSEQFTPVAEQLPPKGVPIGMEWITPSGQIVRGRWAGGACWFPEGSNMYVYYTPISWRPAVPESDAA